LLRLRSQYFSGLLEESALLTAAAKSKKKRDDKAAALVAGGIIDLAYGSVFTATHVSDRCGYA